MNYIKHLSGFFDKVANDKTLNPTHISLYMSLFQFWNCNRFKNPISISRNEVMRISKISSKATYHKCLKNLHSLGYINYEPSYNPFKGSHVYLLNFSDELKPLLKKDRNSSSKSEPVFGVVTEQVLNKSCPSIESGDEQALVPYINNTNILNNLNNLNVSNLDDQAKKIENNYGLLEIGELKEEKSSAKKEEKEMPKDLLLENSKKSFPAFADANGIQNEESRQKSSSTKEKPIAPKIEEVKSYFLNQNFPELQANKFFNYFSSNGWLVGGRTPMVDWQAAAQNWILNAPKFISNEQPNRAKHLNTGTDKDYSEPL